VSYTECNGTQVINQIVDLGVLFTTCALVGGPELQPVFGCGDGIITIGAPCVLNLYFRTITGEDTPYAGNGCLLDLGSTCELQTQNPNPIIVTSGDRVWNSSPGSGPFNGLGKTYNLQSQVAALGDPSYVVTIDTLGYVNILTVCT
jgi:hypothetical protein